MEDRLPKQVKQIMDQMTAAGYKIYIVGGAVRDLILKRQIKDWDFTTDAKPEEILKVFPQGFYNNQFGTVGVKVGEQIYEITTMRKEGVYKDSRHPVDVSWTDRIEEDLARRDFTINAMALGQDNDLVDPFEGQKDLADKKINAVRDPNLRFQEDALRLMRAIRLASELGFVIEENTFIAIQKNADKISNISWERIRDELWKILASDFPYEGVMMLRSANLLVKILPEVEKCFGIMQEGPKHDRVYDIGQHSLNSLKFCSSKDPLVRFACLIHDVGKVDTYKVDKDGNVTFYGHDVVGGRVAQKICERLKLSRKEMEKIVKLVRFHLFTVDERQTDAAIRRFVRNIGLENVEDMFILREADRLGGASNPTSWRTELFKKRIEEVLHKPFSITDLKVNGRDVMKVTKLPPGRRVGEILQQLFQEVAADPSKNTKEYLLQKIKQLN